MRTIETTIYKFNELSQEAQEKAVNKLSNINVDNRWYELIYEDAKTAGLKISGFDIDRASSIDIRLNNCSIMESIDKIKENHGKECETHKTACNYQERWNALVVKYSDGIDTDKVTYENEYDFDNEADDLETEYTKEQGENYLSILRKEYEYQTGKEAIIETIEANEYEFTEDGTLV